MFLKFQVAKMILIFLSFSNLAHHMSKDLILDYPNIRTNCGLTSYMFHMYIKCSVLWDDRPIQKVELSWWDFVSMF